MTSTQRSKTPARTAPAGTVGGLRTRILSVDGHGPTVLLLHGFSDSADSWRAVMDLLHEADRRAIAVDLPHHGRAERPPHGSFLSVTDQFVDAAIAQFDTGDGVVLVGNSVGGLAALRAAQRSLDHLNSVLAIGPAGIHTPWWMSAVHSTKRFGTPIARHATVPLIRGTLTGPRLIAAGFGYAVARGHLSATAKAQYASHWGPGDLHRQLLLGSDTIDELVHPDALPCKPFAVPVEVVWGAHDWICPARGASVIYERYPEVRVQVLDDTGHCPQYDRPELVASLILADAARPSAEAAERDSLPGKETS